MVPFSTCDSLEIPKPGASVKMRYKMVCYLSLPSLIHTRWNLGCFSVLILCHRPQSLGQLRASAWCNEWGESRVRLCSWFVITSHPAVLPDGSSCGSAQAAPALHRDKGWGRMVAPVGHWTRHYGRKRAKPWLPEDHSTGQWWSHGWELDQQSVTVNLISSSK